MLVMTFQALRSMASSSNSSDQTSRPLPPLVKPDCGTARSRQNQSVVEQTSDSTMAFVFMHCEPPIVVAGDL